MNSYSLILFRAFQGVGAAMIIPQSLSLISKYYDEEVKSQAIGIWGGLSGAVSLVGPSIVGLLVDTFTWRAAFIILIPAVILAIYLIIRIIPKDEIIEDENKIDVIGLVFTTLSLTLISFGLIQSSEYGINNIFIILTILLGLLILGITLIYQYRISNPFINIKILQIKHILGANLFTFFIYGNIAIFSFLTTIYLQQVIGMSAAQSGLAQLPTSLSITFISFYSGKLSNKFGEKFMIVTGGIISSIGTFLLIGSRTDFVYLRDFFPAITLIGIGFGLFIPALSKTALTVRPNFTGFASGFNNSISRYTGLIFIAIFSLLLSRIFVSNIKLNFENNSKIDQNTQSYILDESNKLLSIDLEKINQKDQVKNILNESFIDAFRKQSALMTIIGIVGTASAAILIQRKVSVE